MDASRNDTADLDCIVSIAGSLATVPASAILGFTRVADGAEVHRVGAALVLSWHGSLVPVLDLAEDRGHASADVGDCILVVVRQPDPDGPKALLVDRVEDVPPTGQPVPPVPSLLERYVGAPLAVSGLDAVTAAAEPDRFLTVESGGRHYLLPLHDVARIEPFPDAGLQPCGSGLAAVVSGRILKAVPLFGCVPGERPGQSLVLTARGGGQVALVVDALGDVVEPPEAPRLAWGRDGIVEARVVGGSALGVVDVGAVLAGTPAVRLAA